MKQSSIETVDEYINSQAAPFKKTLTELRELILSVAPEAKEMISYRVPCFKYHYMLVGIGVNKKFCSLYAMNTALQKELKEDLKGLRISGSTIHFIPGEPLPKNLIKKIVRFKKKQNEERVMKKEKKS